MCKMTHSIALDDAPVAGRRRVQTNRYAVRRGIVRSGQRVGAIENCNVASCKDALLAFGVTRHIGVAVEMIGAHIQIYGRHKPAGAL